MPVALHGLLAFLIHVAAVWAVLQFIETQWPTLHRLLKAAIVTTLIAFLVGLFHGWLCSWLCR
jgi:hypothetical protein